MPARTAHAFHDEFLRPALERLGWGARGFGRGVPAYEDNFGIAYSYSVPERRPFVVAVPKGDGWAVVERWVGNVAYNLGAARALAANPKQQVLLAPHIIQRRREAEVPLFDVVPTEAEGTRNHQLGGKPLELDRIVGSELDEALERLEIRPNRIAEATLRVGASTQSGYKLRAPVDEALMAHLISARREILNEEEFENASERQYQEIDQDLLNLFGILIFARIVEDREESQALVRGTLLRLADEDDLLSQIRHLGMTLRQVYGSAAVPITDRAWTNADPIRRLIRNLYRDETRFAYLDFRLLDEDILAQLYQLYMQYLLVDREQAAQLKLFGKEDRISTSVREKYGIFYTPRSLVDIILHEVDRHLLPSAQPPRVLDPTCGAGAFLRPALNWILQKWPGASLGTVAECIVGLDRDPRAVALSQQTLARTLVQQGKEALQFPITYGNFLATADHDPKIPAPLGESWANRFDVVIGNPPFQSHAYAASLDMAELEASREQFREEAAYGEVNIAVFFLVQSLRVLRPGGVLGMVVPRRFLRGEYMRLRRTLLAEAEVLSVVDFGPAQVFEDPSITTALLILRKRAERSDEPKEENAPSVFAVKYRDDFAPLVASALRGEERPAIHNILLPSRCYASSTEPWLLLSSAGKRAIARLTGAGVSFTAVFKSAYASDAMSGKGKTFLFDFVEDHGNLVTVRSRHLQREIQIERPLLRPVLLSQNVERFRVITGTNPAFVFYPYEADGQPIAEEDFFGSDARYPLAGDLLRELKPLLDRVKGHKTGRTWYGPGGTRVKAPWHSVITRRRYDDTMLVLRRFSTVPFAAAVSTSSWVPMGALMTYAINPAFGPASEALMAFLNSTLFNWYAIMTTPVFGEGTWADRTGVTVRGLTFPETFLQAELGPVREVLGMLRDPDVPSSPAELMSAEREVDDWVYTAFGFSRAEQLRLHSEHGAFIGNALYKSAKRRAMLHSSLESSVARALTGTR